MSKTRVWRVALPMICVVCLGAAACLMVLDAMNRTQMEETEIRHARQLAGVFKELRAYYTEEVVEKVEAEGSLTPHFDHTADPGRIPLPATMIQELSLRLISKKVRVQLYSPYPFPVRADRQLDGFQQQAWDYLSTHPDAVYTDLEHHDHGDVLRVAIADTMATPACVSCHNTDPQSPKRDWHLGDVRGVLEVDTDMREHQAAAAAMSRRMGLVLLICGIGVIACTVVSAGYLLRR